ncbi:unnamed protein product [Polarella glacialis]|uniref:Uncharacterized protein n=1 Tax=Polarella glacialis TaxID=89957 RepID=A0A813KX27_POLGL|nr:unnamed protein product [Polarella glacialis]
MKTSKCAKSLWNPEYTLRAEACCFAASFPQTASFFKGGLWEDFEEICVNSRDRQRLHCGRCLQKARHRIRAVAAGAYVLPALEVDCGHGHHAIYAVWDGDDYATDSEDDEWEVLRESFKTYCRWEVFFPPKRAGSRSSRSTSEALPRI